MWPAMNSLNIVARLTSTPPATPPRSRTGSAANALDDIAEHTRSNAPPLQFDLLSEKLGIKPEKIKREDEADEKTPLLAQIEHSKSQEVSGNQTWSFPRRISYAVLRGVKVVFTTIVTPARYVIACFYDDDGHFSAIMPFHNFKNLLSRKRRKRSSVSSVNDTGRQDPAETKSHHPRRPSSKRSPSVDSNASSSSAASSEGDDEKYIDGPARHTRSRASDASGFDEVSLHKRSIKIKPTTEEVRKRRSDKAKRQQTTSPEHLAVVASSLKSPSSPTSTSKFTKYPRAPVAPRPLVPRRQPSYTLLPNNTAPRKTLIIDLDETLIHSMAKGGRMSTGHMVEVRLGGTIHSPAPVVYGAAPQPPVAIVPGVPILYYVHERPKCHEFLRKVSRWYNLVIFTASVQEYADPVIDWLERERPYFSGRYYRQHCTLRNGAYIKDLAQVEPDLSRVMILDNSPMSYLFHDDNAIPIEGWISDPTDTNLLHLIPLLEALQYVTDVRALLALRKGQAQQA